MPEPSSCRSCGAPVYWTRVGPVGKWMPVDVEPAEDGNVVLTAGWARVLKAGEAAEGPRHKSHYASCPQAATWRKTR